MFTTLISLLDYAQPADVLIRKGNRDYKAQDYDQSKSSYENALKKSPGNPDAGYNLGNAEFRKNDFEHAAASYDQVANSGADAKLRGDAWYNKGVALMKQNKLEESIDAWKRALKLNTEDKEAQENLAKALLEKKKKEQQQNNNENKDKKPKEDKKDQQKKEESKNKEDDRPKSQQSKLSKQQVEQYLRSLIQREKDVQDKMNQNKAHAPDQPEKDW